MQLSPRGSDDDTYILLVEDDPSVSEMMRWALEDEGLKVVAATDGWQALELTMLHRPSLVVLDLKLPRLDGEDVVAGLKIAQEHDIPIVLVSGDRRLAAKANQLGVFSYLEKPFALDDLVRLARRGLGETGGDSARAPGPEADGDGQAPRDATRGA